jgi:DNA invertase Pin-like site-specific DNA recombinase
MRLEQIDHVALRCASPEATKAWYVNTLGFEHVIGQAERKTIATRVREALRQAELRGVKLGGPNIAEARHLANEVRTQKAKAQNDRLRKVVAEVMEQAGLTKLAEIAQALNLRGIKTNRGCEFTPTHIHRLMKTA